MRPLGRVLIAFGPLSVVPAVAACAEPEDQSLCVVYADYLTAARAASDVDLDEATAGDAADVVDSTIGEVRHLREVADTRYRDQIEQLETALDDLSRVLASVGEDADPATWQPLVEDSVEDVQQAAAQVSDLIDPTCQPEPQD